MHYYSLPAVRSFRHRFTLYFWHEGKSMYYCWFSLSSGFKISNLYRQRGACVILACFAKESIFSFNVDLLLLLVLFLSSCRDMSFNSYHFLLHNPAKRLVPHVRSQSGQQVLGFAGLVKQFFAEISPWVYFVIEFFLVVYGRRGWTVKDMALDSVGEWSLCTFRWISRAFLSCSRSKYMQSMMRPHSALLLKTSLFCPQSTTDILPLSYIILSPLRNQVKTAGLLKPTALINDLRS